MPKHFHDYLAEKRDYHTPFKAWKDTESELENVESIIIVKKTKDGVIEVRTSQMTSLETVGLLDVAKQMSLDGMREE